MTRKFETPAFVAAPRLGAPSRWRYLDMTSVDSWRIVIVSIALVTSVLCVVPTAKSEPATNPPATGQQRMSIVMPLVETERGRRLFVTKGCVICHSIRGVGGRAGPALDAKGQSKTIDVLDFVARMWRGAPVMFKLQKMELGYRVELAPAEIADLAGFIADAGSQSGFSLNEVPKVMRDWMLNERYWEDESTDWRDKLPEEYPDFEPSQNER